MKEMGPLEKAKKYFESRTRELEGGRKEPGPCVTISRETGTGADRVGEKLIEYFHAYGQEFLFFDKNLIDKILQDSTLPQKISEYFPEDKTPALRTTVNELLGIHPPMMKLLHHATKTMLNLGRMGNVILVGRASNIITANLPNSFHVRLVGPHEIRVKNMQTYYQMTLKEATDFVDKEDKARKNYVNSNYHKDVDDPTLYHMVMNINALSVEETATIIGEAILLKLPAWKKQIMAAVES